MGFGRIGDVPGSSAHGTFVFGQILHPFALVKGLTAARAAGHFVQRVVIQLKFLVVFYAACSFRLVFACLYGKNSARYIIF